MKVLIAALSTCGIYSIKLTPPPPTTTTKALPLRGRSLTTVTDILRISTGWGVGGGGGDLQICRVNVEFTRVSETAENDGTKCRRQTAGGAGGAGGRCTAPGKYWNLTLLEGLKSLFQHRI